MSAPAGGSQRFDLTEEVRWNAKERLQSMAFFGVFGVVFATLGAWLTTSPAIPNLNSSGLAWIFWIVAGMMLILAFVPAWVPVTGLVVSDVGVTLESARRGDLILRWDDPGFGLTLRDYSIDTRSLPDEVPHVRLFGPKRRVGTLSRPMAGALILAANARSLPLLQRNEVAGAGKYLHLTITTRIGRPESTPQYRANQRPVELPRQAG